MNEIAESELYANHVAQFLDRGSALHQRGVLLFGEPDLDDLFEPCRAQLAQHAHVIAVDSVLALQKGRAGQNLLLVLEDRFGHLHRRR